MAERISTGKYTPPYNDITARRDIFNSILQAKTPKLSMDCPQNLVNFMNQVEKIIGIL